MENAIQQYFDAVMPQNILDVIDSNVLCNLLNGFYYAIGTGICIVYSKTQDTLDMQRIDAFEPNYQRAFPELCKKWRDPSCGNEDRNCMEADNEEAKKYYKGKCSGLRIYRCQPLSLWDMSFPLCIESKIVGVLISGQICIATQDVKINWQEALQEFGDNIDWGTCPVQDNQLQAVQDKIESYHIHEKQAKELLDVFQKNNGISVDDFKKNIKDFTLFGDITQNLINELHKVKKDAGEQLILRNYDDKLSDIELTDSKQWWLEYGRLLHSLIKLMGIDDICLYSRYNSRYLLKVPWIKDELHIDHLPTREVIPIFTAEKLTDISNITADKDSIIQGLADSDNIWGYRSQTGSGYEVCSTLIFYRGKTNEKSSFIINLFKIFCTESDFAQLIFRDREVDDKYRHKVNLIGHSLRNPLQALQFELENLGKAPPIIQSPSLQDKVKNSIVRIKDASEDLLQLLEHDDRKKTTFNFIEVLTYILKSMEPIARNQPCELVTQDEWPATITIQGNRYRVQRAITCLVDNAIKYSFHGYLGYRGSSNELVRVTIQVISDNGYVKVIIKNYGIGIPEEKLKTIRAYGARADISDKKKTRPGTGMGLPYAIEVLEESGGWLYLTSAPGPSASEEDIKRYHRYVTTVEAGLPIKRGK